LKRFRNFLIHPYGKIQDEIDLGNTLKGVSDFKFFKEEIFIF